ncbi:MAG: hypothetical protein MI923_28965 [Phycisphaerales bacterium]|nr:hypothetical protein [Phycisphaerales bacterium]
MAKDETGRDKSSRRNFKIKIGTSVVMLLAAGIIGFRHFANADPYVAPELKDSVKDQEWKIKCGVCSEKFTLPADQYVAAVENRSVESAGIVCKRCGESAAWRANRPIEYSDEKWNAGWVGRDVLISELEDYHETHPEGEHVASNPSGEEG